MQEDDKERLYQVAMRKIGIGERLRNERKRLGLQQPVIMAHLGAAKKTIINWENGQSSPSADQIASLVEIGFDAIYILTGVRSQPVESTLSQRENAVLEHYRNTDEVGRRAIEQTASALAQSAQKASSKKRA